MIRHGVRFAARVSVQSLVFWAITFISTMLVYGCSGNLFHREHDAAVKAFRDADTWFSSGRFDDAERAYSEFAQYFPSSSLADDAYLRLAHVRLYRSEEGDWTAFSAARSAIDSLLMFYPQTDRLVEARNLKTVIDAALNIRDAHAAVSESLETRSQELRMARDSLAAVHNDISGSMDRITGLERVVSNLRADSTMIDLRLGRLENDLRRTREESERMRRILTDVEQRSE
jgi:outer membrane protein assembly factor BamD (BamD/ComL family)